MTAYRTRFGLTVGLIFFWGIGAAIAQPPKEESKKKEEPPTKEELELRQGSRDFLYKFTEGEEIQSEARQKRVEHRNIQGKHKADTRELQLKLVLSVEKVLPKGGAVINGRVVQVKYNRVGPTEIKKYDSLSRKNADEASDGWELFADAKLKFTVDARGAVSNIQPDAETAAFWNQQPRALKTMVSEDVIKTFLPFVTLPTDLVRRGTDWKEKRTLLDESFGKRDVTLNFSYHGSEQISGRTYQDVRVRGEAKQLDAKPSYEILEHQGDGHVSFDMARGNLREFRFNESYLFNPPGAELVEPENEKEKEKKKKKASYGGGRGGGSGMSGMSGGPAGGGDPRMGKKKKEESKKEKEESDLKPVNKSVKLLLENEVRLTYRGRPVSGE
jgi:hypothetical protein